MSLIILNVDEVRRTLSASGGAFVTHDKEVDIVRFAINSGFADIVLDGQVALRVMYQRPGESQVRAQTLTYHDTDGLHNYYDWQLLSADLAKKGTLTVALCILRTDSEVEEWHTTPCQIRVLDTIHTDDSDEGDETITPTVAQRVALLESMIQRVASGAPIVVSSTSAMTDTDQIYVLSTDGNWYYHNGTSWVAGGTYGAVATDTTLTQSGIPADAKAVGDAIDSIEPGLSNDAKTALLNCFAHVAWVDEHGQDYYDALNDALYPDTGLVSITAVFDPDGTTIYDITPLNDLKAYLTVTGHYANGTTRQLASYTLSGTLAAGTNVITISAENKTTTFNVVAQEYWTYEWDYTDGLPDQNGLTLDQNGSANTISMTSEGLRVQVEDVSERRVRYRYTSLPTDVQYTSGDYELEFKVVTFGSYNQAPYGNGVRMYAGMGDQTNWGTPKGLEITCNTSGTIYLKTNVTNWSTLDTTVPFVTDTWYKVRIHQTLTQADVYVDDVLVGSVPVADIKETVANPQFMATRCSNVLFRAFRFRVFQ